MKVLNNLDLFRNELQNAVVQTVRQLTEIETPTFGQIVYLLPDIDPSISGFYQHDGVRWQKLYTKTEVDDIIKKSQHINYRLKTRLRYLQETINSSYPDYDPVRDATEYSGNYRFVDIHFYTSTHDEPRNMVIRTPTAIFYHLSEDEKHLVLDIASSTIEERGGQEIDISVTFMWAEE